MPTRRQKGALRKATDGALLREVRKLALAIARLSARLLIVQKEQVRRVREFGANGEAEPETEKMPWPCVDCGFIAVSNTELAEHEAKEHTEAN